jgi:predicted secreted hydrolase
MGPKNIFKIVSKSLLCVFMMLVFAGLSMTNCPVQAASGFKTVRSPCSLRFPDDHGPHPGFRSEWWYYTGNLKSSTGRQLGYQVTIFRYQTSPLGEAEQWPDPGSAWRTQQVFIAHAAVTDLKMNAHHQSQTAARAALGMATAEYHDRQTTIMVGNYSINIDILSHLIRASSDDFAIDLHLAPQKPLVLHGKQGYSRKGNQATEASCYYSFTRLMTKGTISIQGRTETVTGLSWMDHEFSTAPLAPDLVGWDWFSLQLDNQTELMVYLLRQADGQYSSASSGSFIDAKGDVTPLSSGEFMVDRRETWTSPYSRGVYPSAWLIQIPKMGLHVTVQAQLANQEMHTAPTTGTVYWEGSVKADGRLDGQIISGKGYVELTGYAEPFKAPL